jgi:DNA-binding beta-propeller fold protein YncE
MLKKIFTLSIVVLSLSIMVKAQWSGQGAWPDTNYPGGTHGIAVSPDGRVWQASYFSTDWIPAPGDTLAASPIIVFNSDGSLVDTIYTVTIGSETDSLTGATSNRGLSTDQDGNILYVCSGPSRIYKINYQTMEGMAKHDLTEIGSSPTKAATASDGTIFVGPVVGNGSADAHIAKYDPDLNYLGNAVDGPPAIARTMEVSADGNTIYWTVFTGSQGIYIYSRPDEFSDYALTDSVLQGMSIETAAWNPATGLLWVSNDARGADKAYTDLTWYGLDVTTKALVDSFTLAVDTSLTADRYPRGLAFSPDGNIAYVGLFGRDFNRIYKFDRITGVQQEMGIKPTNFELSQNYPNPFNPTTNIKFNIAKSGFVTLKVYDILGKEVAQLVNENLTSGAYTVTFNASNLASGTYIYRLDADGVQISKKMILMK